MKKFDMIKKFIKDSTEIKSINNEIKELNIDEKTGVERKITNKNGDVLFCVKVKDVDSTKIYHLFSSLREDLENARIIETVFPFTFKWFFDGKYLRTLAYVPSSDSSIQGTISRYGGTTNFIRTIKRHLINIPKAKKGISVNYVFDNSEPIDEYITAIGSLNKETNLFSIPVELTMSVFQIIKKSTKGSISDFDIPKLNISFWRREVNPDMVDSKKPTLSEKLPIDFENYPPCIKNLMKLKKKGNYNRFLLMTALLNLHSIRDTKFILKQVLNEKEYEHITKGNCDSQLPYIINNIDRYGFPNCKKLCEFCDEKCELSHPLEYYEKRKV